MRAWLKTGTYGTMHLLVAMAVAYAISGSWRVALGIGIVEPAVQTLFYTLHERLWGRVNRRHAPARSAPHADRVGPTRWPPADPAGPLPGLPVRPVAAYPLSAGLVRCHWASASRAVLSASRA